MHDEQASRLGDQITRLMRMSVRFRGMFKTADLGAEFSALMLLPPLRAMGPMRITDLAEVKGADPSTVSRQAAQLVKAGLARREADPADGRASRLAVTDTGVAACDRLRDARVAMLTQVLSDWPADRIAAFSAEFEQFNDAVEAFLRPDPGTPPRETS